MGLLQRIGGWFGRGRQRALPGPTEKRAGSYAVGVGRTEPSWTDWEATGATLTAYEYYCGKSSWVYACARANAEAGASIPWRVEERVGPRKWVPVDDHPLEELLEAPHPFFGWSALVERALLHVQLGGNALWKVVFAGGQPRELWPLQPECAEVGIRGGLPHLYRYTTTNRPQIVYPADEVVHALSTDPRHMYWGFAVARGAAKAIDTDVEASAAQKAMLENHFVPPGIFVVKDPEIEDDEIDKAREKYKTDYAGALNAGTPVWLGTDIEYHQLGQTAKEMDFVKSRPLTVEEICAAFATPPPVVGVLARSTYNNSDAMIRLWWQRGILPPLRRVGSAINRQLVTRHVNADGGARLRIAPDLEVVAELQEQMKGQIEMAEGLMRMGYSRAQANERMRLGMDDEDDGEPDGEPEGTDDA